MGYLVLVQQYQMTLNNISYVLLSWLLWQWNPHQMEYSFYRLNWFSFKRQAKS